MKIDTLMTVLRQLADRKLYPRKIRLSPASMRELAEDLLGPHYATVRIINNQGATVGSAYAPGGVVDMVVTELVHPTTRKVVPIALGDGDCITCGDDGETLGRFTFLESLR